MAGHLFVFTAQGVAEDAPNRRRGARHALLLFAMAGDFDEALARSEEFASREGWANVEFERGGEISRDLRTVTDEVLRSAAEEAIESGEGMVVYSDELSPET